MPINFPFSFTLYVLTTVGKFFVFKKMNIEAWKAIIPFYSTYLLFKQLWNSKMFWVETVTSLAGTAVLSAGLMMASTPETLNTILILFAVSAVFFAVSLFINVKLLHKLAKAFGHGAGYTLGFVCFSYIFFPIVGLGQDQYQAA